LQAKEHQPSRQQSITSSSEAPVQRRLVRYKPFVDPASKEEKLAHVIADKIDALVTESYNEFIGGNYDGASEAQTLLYKQRKREFDVAKSEGRASAMHPSTSAGYVIEGKANAKIIGALSGVQLQVSDLMSGTRPDIVFKIPESEVIGLVDITASNSGGHIFNKKGNWTGHQDIIYVSESIYPSINFESMSPIMLSEDDLRKIHEKGEQKRLMMRETYDAWADIFNKAQNSAKNLINLDFNMNNPVAFKGTATQAERIGSKFLILGLNVTPTKGSNKLTITGTSTFSDLSNEKALEPYRLNTDKADRLDSLLRQNNMDKLLKGSID
jgi:hypothetical protein